MNEPSKPSRYDEVLERRARELAEVVKTVEEGEIFATIAVLSVGTTKLGIPVEHLKEVVARTAVTALPSLPPWISGIAQVRGTLMSVVHLGRWLGLSGMERGPFFAVLDGPQGSLALEVDAVAGFDAIATHELSSEEGAISLRIPGLVRATTKELVLILEPLALLGSKDILLETGDCGAKGPEARSSNAPRMEGK